MRGGTVERDSEKEALMGLSPHARGNRIMAERSLVVAGPIPACAGEPRRLMLNSMRLGAYPRMRGGTPYPHSQFPYVPGLSPHARGNQDGWRTNG